MSKEIIEEGIKIYGIDPKRVLNTEYLESLGDFYKCNICFNIGSSTGIFLLFII